MQSKDFLNVSEAASFLRVSISTLYGWVHQRRIPFRKHGSKLVFSRTDLEGWSKTQEVRPVEIRASLRLNHRGIPSSRSVK